MERNWLIRTSQNQILGPVTKQKLLEFIQKGALGVMDEVASGNGYWFALKEKDLIEKYLYGDIPQGYNPISESKSVLSKRENPDKTTSINTSPANKTQILKSTPGEGIVPNAEDLEFPDITVVHKVPVVAKEEGIKLPDASDLEFPDLTMVSTSLGSTFKESNGAQVQVSAEPRVMPISTPQREPVKSVSLQSNQVDEEAVFPNDDDLAFPDMTVDKTTTKIEKGKVNLDQQYTRTVALDQGQRDAVFSEEDEGEDLQFSLTLDVPKNEPIMPPMEEIVEDIAPKNHPTPVLQAKKDRPQLEDRKLLHDRKTKNSSKPGPAQRDPNRELAHKDKDGQVEPLKKRNDNYLFFILIIIVLIIVAVFFYFKEILNKPLPV